MNNEEDFEWPPPPPPLGPQHQTSVTLSLPAFWSANASGWFAHVESRFRTAERCKIYVILSILRVSLRYFITASKYPVLNKYTVPKFSDPSISSKFSYM